MPQPFTPSKPRLYTSQEVSEMFGFKPDWALAKARAGEFPSLKAGQRRMFTQQHLERIFQILEEPEYEKRQRRYFRPRKRRD